MDVELITPFPQQLEVIKALEDPTSFYVVLVAGRQSGKTVLAECQAIKWCLENKGITVMWVSPTDNQCNKVFKEIVNKFPKSSGFIKKKKGAKGDTEIIFSNNALVVPDVPQDIRNCK